MSGSILFLYGPPGSGKSTIGQLLARDLSLDFLDLDSEIEKEAGKTVSEVFASEGETGSDAGNLTCLRNYPPRFQRDRAGWGDTAGG
jgi:shikimate kinase